jgi:hypothetical protein
VTLAGVDPETADIEVKDHQGRLLRLDPSVRMLQYGYASTSYGSQGKTVDHVLISDSQCKAATNQKEFYVSISRGRQSIAIYTTDREALRDHVQRLGDRELALDLDWHPQAAGPLLSLSRIASLVCRKLRFLGVLWPQQRKSITFEIR